mgnify:CR=1 FL=1
MVDIDILIPFIVLASIYAIHGLMAIAKVYRNNIQAPVVEEGQSVPTQSPDFEPWPFILIIFILPIGFSMLPVAIVDYEVFMPSGEVVRGNLFEILSVVAINILIVLVTVEFSFIYNYFTSRDVWLGNVLVSLGLDLLSLVFVCLKMSIIFSGNSAEVRVSEGAIVSLVFLTLAAALSTILVVSLAKRMHGN